MKKPLEVTLWNPFAHPVGFCTASTKIWGNTQANVKHKINKGMHEHPAIDKCNVLDKVCSSNGRGATSLMDFAMY